MNDATVTFSCVACGKKFSAPARFAGRSAKCAGCGADVTVPKPKEPKPKAPELVSFACRLCGTRMHAPVSEVGRKLKCPDCDTLTAVPPPPAPAKSKRPAAMDGEQYEVYEGEQPRGVDLAKAAPKYVSFECRLCGTHQQAEATRVGEVVVCHDCGAETRVPALRNAPRRPVVSTEDGYDLDASEEIQPTHNLYDEYADRAPAGYRGPEEPESKRDRRNPDGKIASTAGWGIGLFNGITTAFFSTGMFGAWFGLTLGLLFSGPLFVFTLAVIGTGGGMFGWVGAILMLKAAIATAFVWIAVASAIFWAVVDDTAGGAQRVYNWPSIDPTEWGVPLLSLLFALVVSAIPGAIASQVTFDLGVDPANLPWPLDTTFGWVLLGIHLVLPVVWLSQIDSGSTWGVVSGSVLRTMWYAPVTWLTFYAVTVGGYLFEMQMGEDLAEEIGAWAALVLCPVEVLSDLLYVWLLGRLAWVAGAATPGAGADLDGSAG